VAAGSATSFAPLGSGAIFGALASGGIVFAYSVLRQILDFGGEVVNPQRNIPIAIVVGGIIIPLVIYILLQIGFIGAVNWAAAWVQPGDSAGLKGSDWASAPLLNAVVAAGFTWFAVVLLSDAAFSPAATGWVWLGISTRTVYAMSVNRELLKVFQRINRFGTPILPSARAPCSACSSSQRRAGYLFVGMVSMVRGLASSRIIMVDSALVNALVADTRARLVVDELRGQLAVDIPMLIVAVQELR
jgi:amino acid permease